GQRKGLPGGSAQPRYVVDLDPETNRVIVGSAEDLLVEEFEVERVNWISVPVAGVDDPGPRSATAATTDPCAGSPSRTGESNPGVNEQIVIALSTFPDVETARKISRELVDGALVACANVIPAVESIYYWKEKVETNAESLAIFKLTAARYSEFESRLRALHPY